MTAQWSRRGPNARPGRRCPECGSRAHPCPCDPIRPAAGPTDIVYRLGGAERLDALREMIDELRELGCADDTIADSARRVFVPILSLAEIALVFGISRERVRQIEAVGLSRLRRSHPRLREYLEADYAADASGPYGSDYAL